MRSGSPGPRFGKPGSKACVRRMGSRVPATGSDARNAEKKNAGKKNGEHVERAAVHMNISELFIRRPIATSLIMLGIALFGVVAYRALPVNDLPSVDYPTLQVSASLPGGAQETMAPAVATPLERQFTAISGLDSMTSSSSNGNCNIT